MNRIANSSLPWRLAAPFLVMLSPALAHAHLDIGSTSGWLAGLAHPIAGLDHLAAMIGVGLWAAQRGGRALWMVPLTFVLVMSLGGFLGMAGIGIPLVEPGIIASLLVIGVLVAAAVPLTLAVSVLIVGLFALFHGHAHGAEMPGTATGLAYGLGFILATAFLHLVGISLGLAAGRSGTAQAVRYAGGAIALFSVYLCLAQ